MESDELVPDQIDATDFPPEPRLRIADIGTRILSVAAASLENTPNGIPEKIYLATFDPPDDCCDFIAVYPDRLHHVRTSEFPAENERFNVHDLYKENKLGWAQDFVIKLRRPCQPTISDSRVDPFPEADDMHRYAENILIDQNTLTCGVENGIKFRWMLDDFFGKRFQVVVGPLFNDSRADCAGFSWRLTVEIPCYCDFEREYR